MGRRTERILDYLHRINELTDQISRFSVSLSRLAAKGEDLTLVLSEIARLTGEFFAADRVVIFRLLDRERVKMVAAWDPRQPEYSELGQVFKFNQHQLNYQVAVEKKIAIEEDVFSHQKMPAAMREPLLRLGIRSFLGLPLVAGKRGLGSLWIDFIKKKHCFSETEVKLGRIVAAEVSEAIILAQKNNLLRQYSSWFLGKKLLGESLAKGEIIKPEWRDLYLLFTDIRGFTKFTEENSVNRIIKVTEGFFRVVNQAIAPFHGRLNETKGDEAFVFFDNLDDCLRAALAIKKEGGKFLGRFGLSSGIGVHSGRVLVGLFGAPEIKHYRVVGAAINLAKEIQRRSRDNRIFVSEEIYRSAGKKYNFTRIAPLETKVGKIPAFELFD